MAIFSTVTTVIVTLLIFFKEVDAKSTGPSCEVRHGLSPLSLLDLRRGVGLRLEDIAQGGELLATFEVVSLTKEGEGRVQPYYNNSEYVKFQVVANKLLLVLDPAFHNYELYETSSHFSVGPFDFFCPGGEKLTLQHVVFLIEDSNNHAPEFETPEDLVYLVKFPLKPGDLLSEVAMGPPIRAFDVDLTSQGVVFKVFAVYGRKAASIQALHVRTEKDINYWDVHVADLKMRVTIAGPTTVTLIAQDTSIPPQSTTVNIELKDYFEETSGKLRKKFGNKAKKKDK